MLQLPESVTLNLIGAAQTTLQNTIHLTIGSEKERWNKSCTLVVSLEVWALCNACWNILNENPRWKAWSTGSFSVPNNAHLQILAVSPRMSLTSLLVQNEMEQGKKWHEIMFAESFQSRNLAVWQGVVWRHFNMRRNMMCLSFSKTLCEMTIVCYHSCTFWSAWIVFSCNFVWQQVLFAQHGLSLFCFLCLSSSVFLWSTLHYIPKQAGCNHIIISPNSSLVLWRLKEEWGRKESTPHSDGTIKIYICLLV